MLHPQPIIPSGLLLAAIALAPPASAAPRAGEPFVLVESPTPVSGHSLAGTPSGFRLAWASEDGVFSQRLSPVAAALHAPELLGGRATMVTLLANDADYLVTWENGQRLFTARGTVLPSVPNVIPPGFSNAVSSAMGPAGNGFVLLQQTAHWAPGGVVGAAFLALSDGTRASLPVTGEALMFTRALGVTSNGAVSLAVYGVHGAVRVALVGPGTSVNVLPDAAISATPETLLVENSGEDFALFWQSADGRLFARRVSPDAGVLDPAPVDLTGSDAGVETLLDVEPGATSYLVLSSSPAADGGAALRVRRLTFDGTVLDPNGVSVASAPRGDLASTGSDLWLLTTEAPREGAGVIEGRFLGEGPLPEPPPRPPAVPADAGGEPSSPPEAGSPPPGAGGTGGAMSAPDAGDDQAARRESDEDASGCTAAGAGRRATGGGALALVACIWAGLALGRRRFTPAPYPAPASGRTPAPG